MNIHQNVIAMAVGTLFAGQAWAQAEVSVEGGIKTGIKAGGAQLCKAGDDCVTMSSAVYAPFAVRVGTWSLEGTSRNFDPTTVTVGISPDFTVYAGGSTVRTRLTAHLGGGESGFEWDVGGVWTFGGRLGSGNGGPFGRVGIDTLFAGNSDFYHSHFEAPRFELGYQLIRVDDLFLEIAGRGGLTLAGRHRVFDRTRDIGTSFDAGGFATLQLSFLRLHAEAARIFESRNEPKTPLDRGQAELCGILGQRFALCMVGALDRGDVSGGTDGQQTSASYLGLTLGVGEARIFHSAL